MPIAFSQGDTLADRSRTRLPGHLYLLAPHRSMWNEEEPSEKKCGIIVYTARHSHMESVGIREFREKLSSYLESPTPVAITRHGETVGFYIPARRKRKEAELDALRRAGEQLDALVAAAGATGDEFVADFRELRRQARKAKR